MNNEPPEKPVPGAEFDKQVGVGFFLDSPGLLYGSMAVLLFLSAFFSASETSFTSVNMIRIRNMAEEGNAKAATAVKLAENYDRTLSTILIGNNLVNIAMSSLTTVAATTAFGDAGVAVATGVATLLILTFGEILPKSWAKENSERLVLLFAEPLRLCTLLLSIFPHPSLLISAPRRLRFPSRSSYPRSMWSRPATTLSPSAARAPSTTAAPRFRSSGTWR